MKKIITIVFLLISTISFSQNREYKKATNLYNSKQYSEANVILEKLLQKEYGELDEEMSYWVLYMNAGCYLTFNDNKTGYKKFSELLDFVNKSESLYPNKSDKDKTIKSISDFLNELKLKLPSDNNLVDHVNNESKSNSTKVNDIENNTSEINKTTSDDKTVTLTVSGSGKTIEEAKLNALRSAIEQAFGAFVSSKTEILNDQLIKDEIVSVASGNVEKYDIISQVEIPNIGFATTLNATVSIAKLTSFAESKGVVVEFEGGMFGMKIKLQKLNEKNELNACINILSVVHELLQIGYDYVLETGEPKRFNDSKYYFEFKVSGTPNSNFYKAMNYLKSSLSNLQMSPNEIIEYKNVNKGNYDFRGFHLRNFNSFQTLKNIDYYANYYAGNFNLIINNQKKISGPDLGGNFNNYNWQSGFKTFTFPSFMFGQNLSHSYDSQFYFDGYNKDEYKGNAKRDQEFILTNESFNFKWQQLFDIGEIEKINSISVVGKGVNSSIKLGGFVIFEDENKYIIGSPYSLYWDGFEEVNDVEINTGKKIFEGKSNMNLLKNNQQFNKLYNKVFSHNLKNNTDWHVPSEEELKLYIKEVASTHSRINDNNDTYYSSTISNNYSTEMFCFDMRENSNSEFLFNDNQYFGIPFNSRDSFKLLESYFYNNKLKNINTRNGTPVIPLVKYIIK
jgi:hypothetical protein